MERTEVVQQFVTAMKGADRLDDVGTILGDAARSLGFDHFALIQTRGPGPTIGPLRLTNFSQGWVDRLVATEYHAHDPVLAACQTALAPFAWDAVPGMMRLTQAQKTYMAKARGVGLEAGFSVPFHVPGEATAVCSFVTTGGHALPTAAMPAAYYLAGFALEAARRLMVETALLPPVRQRLTERQLDCLVLAARGKSNWVIGQLLGLSAGTVHKYLENAKRRYGVSSRAELVVRALYEGELSFRKILIDAS